MRKPPEDFVPSIIEFIGEQDGKPERLLKDRLASYFVDSRVNCRAYLAKVDYKDENPFSVALCLFLSSPESSSLQSDIGDIFASLFRRNEHLDTIKITADQEVELAKVCSPFFDSDDLSHDTAERSQENI